MNSVIRGKSIPQPRDYAEMLPTTLTRKNTCFSFAFALITLISIGPVSAETLQGNVFMDNQIATPKGPSLKRNDARHMGDQFAGPAEEIFDAPAASFDSQKAMLPPPPPTFGLGVSDEGGDFVGQQGVPTQAPYRQPQIQPQSIPQGMLQPPMGAMDPENSQHMQLQWDLWHRRVAEAIFVKFDNQAQIAFANSRPLSCLASYTVTRDHHIKDIRLVQKSENFMFNLMLMNVLRSMDGNPLLEFPPGTRRQFVPKTGTFSRNCGVNGFKHTTNDNERINNVGMPRY